MKQAKTLAILNALVVFLVVFWNYYANTGVFGNNTVGSLSDQYNSLFTPAGYTFAIWGIIYLGLFYQAIYFLRQAFKESGEHQAILKSTPWLILANLANGVWIWLWLTEHLLLSVIVLFLITAFLLIAVIKLNMERWDAPVTYMAGVWWPIDIYVGWTALASIANTSIYLKYIGWSGGLDPETWTIIMIAVAVALNLFMIITRNMREFAVVGIWALVGIAVRHQNEVQEIMYAAYIGAAVLFIAINIHAYKNRATLPFVRRKVKN